MRGKTIYGRAFRANLRTLQKAINVIKPRNALVGVIRDYGGDAVRHLAILNIVHTQVY